MRQTWLVALLAGVFCGSDLHAAETSAGQLGYPSDKRVLILYANFMGGSYEFNASGQQLLKDQNVQSVGLMPTCPWFQEFAKWCRENPGHDVGVCLTMNSPIKVYRWGPVSSRDSVPSLVDADGYLWETELQFALRADAKHVEREIRQQIKRVREAGVRPTHLVPFLGTLLTRPDLLNVYLDIAEEYWVPAVMLEMTPEVVEKFRNDGFPLTEDMLERIAKYPLPKLDGLEFVPDAESYENKRDAFFELVKNLKPGLTQIVAGPAVKSAAIQRMSEDWQNRVWDDQLLTDPKVKEFLKDEGVILTNWKQVMERFEKGTESPAKNVRKRQLKDEKENIEGDSRVDSDK